MNPAKAVRCKRVIVRRLDVRQSDNDKERQRQQLDDHHDVVRASALADTEQQQPRDQRDDGERRDVDQNRNPRDMRRRLEESVNRRIGAQERRSISGGQPRGKVEIPAEQ